MKNRKIFSAKRNVQNKGSIVKDSLKQLFWEVIGSIFVAAAIYNFAVQAEFPLAGFSGISLILYRLFEIPIGVSTIFLNIPVMVLCFKLLGRKFFLSSIRCMVISSIFIDYIAPLFPVYEGERLLAAICTGVLSGIGYGIIYMQNSSTGGSDFIIMAVKALKPYISLGKILFLIDAAVVLVGGLIFQDVNGIIYGLIITFLMTVVVDKLMYGVNAGKMTLVVTNKAEEICKAIHDNCRRGSTILPAAGGYKNDPRQVVMCVCNNKEMYLVGQLIKKLDPDSFMIILESNEVHGEGFRTLQLGMAQEHSEK